MKTPKYFAVFFTFIAFNTVECEETNIRTSASSEVPQPVQRRYSEAILASDYSRSVDNMLKKNFVDWLLGRREKKSDNFSDFGKRQVDFQIPDFTMHTDSMEGSEGSKKFLPWVLKYKQMTSAQNNVNAAVCQQTLDLLMSMDLCNARKWKPGVTALEDILQYLRRHRRNWFGNKDTWKNLFFFLN